MNVKIRPLPFFTLASAALLVAVALAPVFAQKEDNVNREEQWKKVFEAVGKGLPKTGIELIEPIIESAIADKAYPEAIKAVAQKITLEGMIEGNKAEEKITRMEAEIAKAARSAPEMVPVMEAILANWYWSYFQQNSWRYMQRTETGGPGGDDILSWDLARILAEIDGQFQKALSHTGVLKKTPGRRLRYFSPKGQRPGFVPADDVRFPRARRAALLPRGRTGGIARRRRLRPDGR